MMSLFVSVYNASLKLLCTYCLLEIQRSFIIVLSYILHQSFLINTLLLLYCFSENLKKPTKPYYSPFGAQWLLLWFLVQEVMDSIKYSQLQPTKKTFPRKPPNVIYNNHSMNVKLGLSIHVFKFVIISIGLRQ